MTPAGTATDDLNSCRKLGRFCKSQCHRKNLCGTFSVIGTSAEPPCAFAGMLGQAAKTTYILPQCDGLIEPWYGRVWCNPPYGPNVGVWTRRMAAHRNGIMLLYARVETADWQEEIFPFADAILFLAGRVRFYLPSGEQGKSETAVSVLLAYGQSNVDTLRNAGIAGSFYGRAEMLPGTKASTF